MADQIEYSLAEGVTTADIRNEVAAAFAELKADPSQITVKQTESGMGGVEALVVAFAPVAAQIVKDLWTYIIFPRIRAKFGPKALEEKKK